MSWTAKKTFYTFYINLAILCVLELATLILIYLNVKDRQNNRGYFQLLYITGTSFGTGMGALWFRIFRGNCGFLHASLHILAFVFIIIGHYDMCQFLFESEFKKAYKSHPISLVVVFIYALQLALACHLMLVRYSKQDGSYNMGFHSFIGAILLFICLTDGILECHAIIITENVQDATMIIAAICLFLYGMVVWYIILNPYFEWRILKELFINRQNEPDPPIRSRSAGSRSSGRRTSASRRSDTTDYVHSTSRKPSRSSSRRDR